MERTNQGMTTGSHSQANMHTHMLPNTRVLQELYNGIGSKELKTDLTHPPHPSSIQFLMPLLQTHFLLYQIEG